MTTLLRLLLSRPAWLIPVIVWFAFAGLLLAYTIQDDKVVQPVSLLDQKIQTAVHTETSLPPGFTTSYDKATGRWTWLYIQQMKDGCEQLLLREHPVTLEEKVITIEMKTYKSDEVCVRPTEKKGIRGGINADPDVTFKAFVDGELVSH